MIKKHARGFGAARLLSGHPFSEMGRPYGGKLAPGGEQLAVFSVARAGHWAGRILPSTPTGTDRVTLFDAALKTCLAVCDGIRFTVHDAAFHPTQTWMAMATGHHDGGHFYDGETILWNWQSGERRSLFSASGCAIRCRFDDAGALTVLFTEDTDEEDQACHACITVEDVLGRSAGGPIQVDAVACDPQSKGWGDPGPRWPEPADPWGILPRLAASTFRPSFGVWDVAWWSDTELAVAADQPALTVHRLADGTARRHEVALGQGVQLLRGGDDVNLLHVFLQEGLAAHGRRSQLLACNRDALTPWEDFDHAHVFSVGQDGGLLGRATGDFPDISLTAQRTKLTPLRLGRFDVFNHALCVRRSRLNYFLVGDSPEPWHGKHLWSLGAHGLTKCMDWDAEGQRMHSLAAVCDGERIFIRASQVHHPHEALDHWFVDAFDAHAGWAHRWTWPASSPVTALTTVERSPPWVAVGCADATLWLLDALTGEGLDQLALGDGRTSVVPTAMEASPDGRHLAVGCADGRVWVVDLLGT